MTLRQQIEVRTIQIVDLVVSGQRLEDDFVEAKAEWPDDPARAARRIAGHANAAHGDRILWIIGLDEDAHTVNAKLVGEALPWWEGVAKRFADGVTPDPTCVVVATQHGVVTALSFETDRAPYMVTGTGSGAEREIPWRELTRVRSAKRFEVLSMLAPAIHVPTVEVLDPVLTAVRRGEQAHIHLRATAFFETSGAPALLARHRWVSELIVDGIEQELPTSISFQGRNDSQPLMRLLDSKQPQMLQDPTEGAWSNAAGVEVRSAGALTMTMTASSSDPRVIRDLEFSPHVRATFKLYTSGFDGELHRPVQWDETLASNLGALTRAREQEPSSGITLPTPATLGVWTRR